MKMDKSRSKPVIIEAFVDPFEPPMPPKVEMEFVTNLAESFVKGQPYAKRIGLTLFRNQVHGILKNIPIQCRVRSKHVNKKRLTS